MNCLLLTLKTVNSFKTDLKLLKQLVILPANEFIWEQQSTVIGDVQSMINLKHVQKTKEGSLLL